MAVEILQLSFFNFFISFVSILLLCFFFTKKLTKPKTTTTHHPPPSPPALPIIGHLHLLSSNLPNSLKTLSSLHGPLLKIRIGASTMIVVSNSNTAKQVLKTHDLNFSSKPNFTGSNFALYKGSSFFAAEYGVYWRFMKKVFVTQLVSPTQLNRFSEVRKEEIVSLLKVLAKFSKKGEECDIGMELMTMTNNIICRMGMSTKCSGDDTERGEVREITREIGKLAAKLSLGDALGPPLKYFDLFGYGKKLRNVYQRFDVLLEGIMKEHEKEERNGFERRKDMLDILLEIYKDDTAEVRLTRNDIKAFLLEIFLGGTDTTSLALQWTLAELINHPNVFNKLREEIKTVVGTSRVVEESDIPNLPYLHSVVKESLRLHVPIPLVPRKCREDCKINGYDILKNDRVFINLYAIMRDPDLWNNPMEFVPERFLVNSIDDEQQEDMRNQQAFQFLPFSSGRRGCPGATLALSVMHLTTAALVQCFDWKIKGGEKVDMEEGSGFSQGMAQPLLCYPIAISMI